MAFGFLGRARAEGDGSNAARPENAPATTTGSVADRETDVASGFTASAADGAGDESDAADIPDPTAYSSEGAASPPLGDESFQTEVNDTEVADEPATRDTSNTTGDQVGGRAAAAATASTDIVATVESPPSPLLIVGLPLAATGMLMGLYWWILRSGAV